MESDMPACANHKSIGHNCCEDKISSYLITDDFSSIAYHFIRAAQSSFVFLFGITDVLNYNAPYTIEHNAHSPPGEYLPKLVKLALICVFRI